MSQQVWLRYICSLSGRLRTYSSVPLLSLCLWSLLGVRAFWLVWWWRCCTTLQHHLLLPCPLTSAANSPANLKALWKCAAVLFYLFNFLLLLKTLGELRKCKKHRKGEKTNTKLIFEIRTDLAVDIVGKLIFKFS